MIGAIFAAGATILLLGFIVGCAALAIWLPVWGIWIDAVLLVALMAALGWLAERCP